MFIRSEILKLESAHRLAEREYLKSKNILNLAIPLLGFFSILNYYQNNTLQYWIEGIACGLLLLFRFLIPKGFSLTVVDTVFAVLCLAVFVGILMNGGYHGTGILWIAGLPFIGFYLFGIRLGFYWSFAASVVVGGLLVLQGMEIVNLAYTREYLTVYLCVLLFYSWFAWYSESARLKNKLNLISANNKVLEEKYERERMADRLEKLMGDMDEVYFKTDRYGTIEGISESIRAVTGFLPDELIQRPASEYCADENDWKHYLEEVRSKGAVKGHELKLLARDGSHRFISVNARELRDQNGHFAGIEGLFQDVTPQKEAELAIMDANRKLQKAHDEAIRASNAKSEFLSVVSHELRTPLHGIIGMHELLSEMEDMPEEQRTNLAIAQSAARSLGALVNDVLDMSKIEAGAMTLNEHESELVSCIRDAMAAFAHAAREKGLTYELVLDHVPEKALVDPVRLRQVLLNLIGNAVKFTEQGHVRVIVSLQHADSGEGLFCRVSDSGIGIPEEYLASIFEPFTQVHPFMESKGGTGLGTAIVKRFVELMGGEVRVESKVDEGSEFTFTIPVKRVGDSEMSCRIDMISMKADCLEGDEDQHRDFQQEHGVLLVEDDPISRRIVSKQLERAGLRVDVADNGLNALEMVKKNTYHLILMDVRMPGMDGIELTGRIRELEKETGRHVSIVGLSAHAVEDVQQLCRDTGMDDFLIKPVDPKTILDKVGGMLATDTEDNTSS